MILARNDYYLRFTIRYFDISAASLRLVASDARGRVDGNPFRTQSIIPSFTLPCADRVRAMADGSRIYK